MLNDNSETSQYLTRLLVALTHKKSVVKNFKISHKSITSKIKLNCAYHIALFSISRRHSSGGRGDNVTRGRGVYRVLGDNASQSSSGVRLGDFPDARRSGQVHRFIVIIFTAVR